MAIIEQTIEVYMKNYGIPPRVHIPQGDTGRLLRIKPMDYTIPAGAEVKVKIERANKTTYTVPAILRDGVAEADATQIITTDGETNAMLLVKVGADEIKSFRFIAVVHKNTSGEPDTPEQGKTFEQYLSETENARDEAVAAAEGIVGLRSIYIEDSNSDVKVVIDNNWYRLEAGYKYEAQVRAGVVNYLAHIMCMGETFGTVLYHTDANNELWNGRLANGEWTWKKYFTQEDFDNASIPLQQRIDKVESVNHRQQIEIDMNTAFRKDKYSIEVSDSAVAYSKDVPVGALPWGEVKSVGGMSRRCTNLWDEEWESGYFNSEGSPISSSSRIRTKNNIPVTPNTEYFFCSPYSNVNGIFFIDSNSATINSVWKSGNSTFTTPSNCVSIKFDIDVPVYNNDIAIIKGTSGTYEPYTPNLISANLSEIESRGTEGVIGSKPFPSDVASQMHGINSEVYDEVELAPRVYPNMKVVSFADLAWNYSSDYRVFTTDSLSNLVRKPRNEEVGVCLSKMYAPVSYSNASSMPNVDGIMFFNESGRFYVRDYSCNSVSEFIEKNASLLLHYEAVEGGTDYEAVLLEKKTASIKVGSNLVFREDAVESGYRHNLNFNDNPTYVKPASYTGSIVGNYMSNLFTPNRVNSNNSPFGYFYVNGNWLVFTDNDRRFTSASAFAQFCDENNVEIIYELATPQILDVSEYFTDENYRFIEVEGGGSITFKQTGDYKLAIPSVVEYDVKVVD